MKRIVFILTIFSLILGNILISKPVKAQELAVSDVQVKNTADKTAEIHFKTDNLANYTIYFGLDRNFGSWISSSLGLKYYHKAVLGGLQPETTYYFQIEVFSPYSDTGRSFVYSFKTAEFYDKDDPEIFNLSVAYLGSRTILIQWETNELSSSYLEYGHSFEYEKKKNGNRNTKYHQVLLTKLQPSSDYYFKVFSKDKAGNTGSKVYRNRVTTNSYQYSDKQDLQIRNINVEQISSDSAVIRWQANNYSDGFVKYSDKINRYRKTVKEEGFYDRNHKIKLSGLKPNTVYYFKVGSKDIFKNKEEILGHSFETGSEFQVEVKGVDYSEPQKNFPNQISAIYKKLSDAAVYVITNGKKYLIPGPSSFSNYGLDWADVQIVSAEIINQIPDAKLVKIANSPKVYYIYKSLNHKKAILSEKVFESYDQKWQDIITISNQDLNSYSDVKLIKLPNKPEVYLLENNQKRKIMSEEAFLRFGFKWNQIGFVNEIDLGAYANGEAVW